MNSYVALLYSIVLGPGRRVVMADLKKMAEELGYSAPRTLVATGNLVFATGQTSARDLESPLEEAFSRTFGRHVDIIVRSGAGWQTLEASNPFHDEGEADATQVHVRVMRDPLDETALDGLRRYCTAGERLAIVNGDLWIHFPGKASESKLLGAITTKRLGVGTFRNWNTVKGLAEMLRS
ncbi:DUF1697 domain-containing protein [Ensifer adhaerens]|uniref:DUF1697 domain-containing protein n=1 Tax=Ensifer adhaerens TaxID=106592 RepID=UPI000CF02C44|nr:DUF1697 domain-containing protein [Ensifer adhaerens]